ncbi:Amidinotransferase family protein [Monoraphidium neglectum]|uniref:Amidinotransferase family protein n=1 Tax=Monoraphidium neglectum TaxID=145388 RepID=A0A0D2LB98_9CHLO|nr:Amidinotransferase family protein [Monoraphidium neglectum]KIZ04019.1 Amidinotransferase family protein [Monoraphidium neglectum]|eukprot:XP_013903038.1 Amidinotransferase family protein [Monoraphidium neglectum]
MDSMLESIGQGPVSPKALLSSGDLPQLEAAAAALATAGAVAPPSPAAAAAAAAGMRHVRSFVDCEEVLLQASLEDPKPTAAPQPRRADGLLEGGELRAVQEDEDEMAQVVIVCEPEGSSLMMGGLHPRGSLFERPVNIESAKAHHTNFRQARRRTTRGVLRDHGVRVLTVREILAHGVDEHMGARVALEDLAMATLTYQVGSPGVEGVVGSRGAAVRCRGCVGDDEAAVLPGGCSLCEVAEADRRYLADSYKREVIEHMSVTQLIDIILINPTVTLTPSGRDTGLTASYTFEPMSNLVYTRDQQITTCRGIVMGRLRSQQRFREVELMRFCFDKLGLPIIGQIEAPGFLEGGDFFPLGRDLAMVGVGLRSNVEAAQQLMERDLLGTRRLAVVRDDYDRHQDRMHLDCVFSALGGSCCLMLEEIMGESSPMRRLVDEYCRDPVTGRYRLARTAVEFASFMAAEGYSIIPISAPHQLAYACNVLNLGRSRIVSVHAPSARQIINHPRFKGDVRVIDFSSITSMYGAAHCASQVVMRVPAHLANRV